MRFILGMIVGAILVIGAAYVHDAAIDPERTPTARPMVNWPVVSEDLRGINNWFHDQWDWLSRQIHRPE